MYVREGAILPIASLTQSTNQMPVSPLILRVDAGDDCRSDLYQDDGKSFAFCSGQSLRLHFAYELRADGSYVRPKRLVRLGAD